MRTKPSRVLDNVRDWWCWCCPPVAFEILLHSIIAICLVWAQRGFFIPLLPYLNPLWLHLSFTLILAKDAVDLRFRAASYLHALSSPDLLGYYIFQHVALRATRSSLYQLPWRAMILPYAGLLIICLATGASLYPRIRKGLGKGVDDPVVPPTTVKSPLDSDKPPLIPPLLFPAKTTHTRFFPEQHTFAYSYFYVGIPIGWTGRAGIALSADLEQKPHTERKYGWFHVDSADYLYRTPLNVSLETKLRHYLRGEGIRDHEWSFAYLCTAPRFLGYSFNPVSFWYIYGPRSELTMMLLEVNNTFDERRIYLLKAGDEVQAKFNISWEKDFHVSPFNSRKGSYSLQAQDPYRPKGTQHTSLDNVITLRSSKNHIKLVARVFSQGPAIDPTSITTWQLSRLIAGWFWVGFFTSPRIIYEAFRLFFLKKLHVWYRPEVLPSSLARRPTTHERKLETYFSRYIHFLVEQTQSSIKVIYRPPGDIGTVQTLLANQAGGRNEDLRILEINVLSPVFYSRIVHYAHLSECFNREGFCADDKNRTVLVSNQPALDALLQEDLSRLGASRRHDRWETWRWDILRRSRCVPPAVSYTEVNATTEPRPGVVLKDIRTATLSLLDRFVMDRLPAGEAADYCVSVTRSFIAQRYVFGIEPLVRLAEYVLDLGLVVAAYLTTSHVLASTTKSRTTEQRDNSNLGIAVCGCIAARCLLYGWGIAKGTAMGSTGFAQGQVRESYGSKTVQATRTVNEACVTLRS